MEETTVLKYRGDSVAELSDETLMQFADGVLDKREHDTVAAIVSTRPELAAKVERFRQSRRILERAFGDGGGAASDDLIRQIREGRVGQPHVADLSALRAARIKPATATRRGWGNGVGMALAASVSLLVGTAAGWYGRGGEPSAPQGLLQVALESVASGSELVTVGPTGSLTKFKPTATFADKSHRFCRQYTVVDMGAAGREGVACRDETAGWKVLAEEARAVRSSKSLAPAAGADGSVASTIERIADGDYLGRDEEARLIGGNWDHNRLQ